MKVNYWMAINFRKPAVSWWFLRKNIIQLMPEEVWGIIDEIVQKSQNKNIQNQLNRDKILYRGVQHKKVRWTQWRQKPIIGIRYAWVIWNKFNLWATCEVESTHMHGLLKIRTPQELDKMINLLRDE